MAYDVPPLHGPPTIAWEIQSIERLLERLENREMLKELVKQQRDIIYTNIATHASRWERYQMYNKWGIRKLSTSRLRTVVYGMLWKDPKRCAFSPICFWQLCFISLLFFSCALNRVQLKHIVQAFCPHPSCFVLRGATHVHSIILLGTHDHVTDGLQVQWKCGLGNAVPVVPFCKS